MARGLVACPPPARPILVQRRASSRRTKPTILRLDRYIGQVDRIAMGTPPKHVPWWRLPAATTVAFALLGLSVLTAMLAFFYQDTAHRAFVMSTWFRIWLAMGTLSVAI